MLSVARVTLCFILMGRTDIKVKSILSLHKREGNNKSIIVVLIKKPSKTCRESHKIVFDVLEISKNLKAHHES